MRSFCRLDAKIFEGGHMPINVGCSWSLADTNSWRISLEMFYLIILVCTVGCTFRCNLECCLAIWNGGYNLGLETLSLIYVFCESSYISSNSAQLPNVTNGFNYVFIGRILLPIKNLAAYEDPFWGYY